MRWRQVMDVYREHRNTLYAVALSVTADRASAEDAVHDAVISVAKAAIEPSNWKAYLLTAVRNAAFKQRLASGPHRTPHDWLQIGKNLPEFERRETLVDPMAAVRKLPVKSREVVVLHGVKGMTFREIAALSGESVNTISSRYRRSIDLLGDLLNEKS